MFRPLPFERSNGPVAGWCLACGWPVVWVVVGLRTRARSARARRDSRPPPPHDRQACASRISHCPHPTTITPSRQSTGSLSRKKKTGHPFPFNDLRKDSGWKNSVVKEKGSGAGVGCRFSREHFGADVELGAVSGGERAVERAERVAPLLPCHTRELLSAKRVVGRKIGTRMGAAISS